MTLCGMRRTHWKNSHMQISKKSTLVELLTSVQVVCLTVALLGGAFWVRASVRKIVRNQIGGDNKLIATQISKLIDSRKDIGSIEYGSSGWEELQTLIEDVELPNDGYVCIAGGQDGKLICHPKIRTNPALHGANVGGSTITVDGKESTLLQKLGDTGSQEFTGTIGRGNGTEVVSVAALSNLDSVLLVHQSERGFRKAVNFLLLPIGAISLFLGFALILVTRRVTVSLLTRYENKIAEINAGLEDTVRVRSRALAKTQEAVILGLAKLSESRDNDTGQHLERIGAYVTILARNLSKLTIVSDSLIEYIGFASSLHDIGKVGVPDRVLLKPGPLTPDERAMIEVHPRIGQECLQAIGRQLGEDNFLGLATEICAYHHEKWDGTGYPHRLAGTDIPLSARIVALADVYDALRSRRPYKDPMSHTQARLIIAEGSGTHFDPQVVEAFLMTEPEFEELSNTYSQPESAPQAVAGQLVHQLT